ncbi:lysophospholipid acyltransferase family protein [bacterium]|nr:lysophospholipid acyltransferase family protein [bacterium]
MSKKRRFKNVLLSKLPSTIAFLVRCWDKSCSQITVVNGEYESELALAGKGCVYVTWHQRLFNLFFFKYQRPVTIMISRSKDGDLATGVADKFGFTAVRGSSSRGGATAMYQLIEKMQKNPETSAGMLGDGPRGPARKLKMGALKIAQATGAPILPFAYSAKSHKLFASWDRFMLPLPFSPLVVIFGEPMLVPAELSQVEVEGLRCELEASLNDLTDQADSWWRDA